MSWFEVLNIALNAKQSYDLHKTRQRLQEIEGLAITDNFVKQVLDSARNLVFETSNNIKTIESHLEKTPQPVYVALKLFEWRLKEAGIVPGAFPEFADKEYVNNVQNKLADDLQKSRTRLTSEEVNQAEECFRAITQMTQLEKAIEAQSAHEKQIADKISAKEELKETEEKWNVQHGEKRRFNLAGMGAMAYVPVALSMVCVCGAISEVSRNDLLTALSPIVTVGLLVSITVAAVGGVILWAKNPSREYSKLKRRRTELKKIISAEENFLLDVPVQFSEQSSEKLSELQATWRHLIDQVMGKMAGYDKLIALSNEE